MENNMKSLRNTTNMKNSESLVKQFLENGGKVTVCKDGKMKSDTQAIRAARSKGHVAQNAYQTGNVATSLFQRQTERTLNLNNCKGA